MERGNFPEFNSRCPSLTRYSVVQRQMWLMENEKMIGPDKTVVPMSKARAYDQARQEFYAERLKEDIERRVAKEEAEATGAYFGKSYLETGMEIEDQMFEKWKAWAIKEYEAQEIKMQATYGGPAVQSAASLDNLELLKGLDDLEAVDTPPV